MRARLVKWIAAVLVGAVAAVTIGTWAYIELVRDDPSDRLSLDTDETTPDQSEGPTREVDDIEGRWTVASGSQAGYRVEEVLFGQRTEGVGRTEDVAGELRIKGTTVTEATFTVDLRTVTSDDDRRDRQFRGRIMDVDSFPTADFVLTGPIELSAIPAEAEQVTVSATGDLTLRGTTRPVTLELEAEIVDGRIRVAGSLSIVFEEWGIPNPSNQVASTGDVGELELLLELQPA